MFAWLDTIERALGTAELWIYKNIGRWPMYAATWLFHGAVGFLCGLAFGVFGWGFAVGAYGTREIGHSRKYGLSMDSVMDFVFPALLGLLGTVLR